MNQEQFFDDVIERARFLAQFDIYKTVFRDGNLILVNNVFWQSVIHYCNQWKKANLDSIDFKGLIERAKKEMLTSRAPFFEIGCIEICHRVLEYLEKKE